MLNKGHIVLIAAIAFTVVLTVCNVVIDAVASDTEKEPETIECIWNGQVVTHQADSISIGLQGSWGRTDGKIVFEYSTAVQCRAISASELIEPTSS